MKKISTLLSILGFMTLVSCGPNNQDDTLSKELEEQKKKIENLETKLTATEAQLLNIRAELSRYKAADSLKTTVEK